MALGITIHNLRNESTKAFCRQIPQFSDPDKAEWMLTQDGKEVRAIVQELKATKSYGARLRVWVIAREKPGAEPYALGRFAIWSDNRKVKADSRVKGSLEKAVWGLNQIAWNIEGKLLAETRDALDKALLVSGEACSAYEAVHDALMSHQEIIDELRCENCGDFWCDCVECEACVETYDSDDDIDVCEQCGGCQFCCHCSECSKCGDNVEYPCDKDHCNDCCDCDD